MKKKLAASALFTVVAFKEPGPKWQKVGAPVERSKAVSTLANEWKSGNLARIIPVRSLAAKAS